MDSLNITVFTIIFCNYKIFKSNKVFQWNIQASLKIKYFLYEKHTLLINALCNTNERYHYVFVF